MRHTPARVLMVTAGRPESGPNEYSRKLSASLAHRPDVLIVPHVLTPRDYGSTLTIAQTNVDLVHLQFRVSDWLPHDIGAPPDQTSQGIVLDNLASFLSHLALPLVVTLHDVYDQHFFAFAPLIERAAVVVVHSNVERTRLLSLGSNEVAGKVRVIPHYVDNRVPHVPRASRSQPQSINILVHGRMMKRKNPWLAIETIRYLPSHFTVTVAGKPKRKLVAASIRVAHWRTLIRHPRSGGRLRLVLGWVSSDKLDGILANTDVCVCPYSTASASGSLATSLSLGVPVVASDIDVFSELARDHPGVLTLFSAPAATSATGRLADWRDFWRLATGAFYSAEQVRLVAATITAAADAPIDVSAHDQLHKECGLEAIAETHSGLYAYVVEADERNC